MRAYAWLVVGLLTAGGQGQPAHGQIPIPADAPAPMSPVESGKSVRLPDGFRVELVAAEPIVRNPSGVCWDARGRMFVCELHGYNLEGQYDIEELNRTGKLDREVRRIPAPEHARRRAEKEQTGTVKCLVDSDGDGRFDRADVWADGLPACFGLVPARDGVIVVCSPHIMFLADRDGDGNAEVRERLYTGFRTGILERRMNAPRWGLDGWIYVGRGQGGTVTGPGLNSPVALPANDFRFLADGSAIEPVPEGTHTFGFAFSGSGDRFVISTGSPAIYVAPLPWRYLVRNRRVKFGSLRRDVSPGQKTYPISRAHPWRRQRAEDPGFEEFYRSRYGRAESAPNGFFTSACSPLVYQDSAMPLTGHLLACEPAQNMIHRSVITRDGLVPRLHRPVPERESEFLASRDIWFHPIALAHAPDGSIVVSDFYREIIEDYSAIPRYLQQQYRLKHGEQHGRVWRLTHRDVPDADSPDLAGHTPTELVKELGSDRFWRRRTAQRLLTERLRPDPDQAAVEQLRGLLPDAPPATVIAAMHTLDETVRLTDADLRTLLRHSDPGVLVRGLRLADQRFATSPNLVADALMLLDHSDARVQLQLALSLGETDSPKVRRAMARLLRQASDVPWMSDAVLSSLSSGGEVLLGELLSVEARDEHDQLAKFVRRLGMMIGDTRDSDVISDAIVRTGRPGAVPSLQHATLQGLADSFRTSRAVGLTPEAKAALKQLRNHESESTAAVASSLVVAMRAETPTERTDRLAAASRVIDDIQVPVSRRLSAVTEIAREPGPESGRLLLERFQAATPAVREAILASLFARREHLSSVVAAIEDKRIPASSISAVRRAALLKHPDIDVRRRAERLVASAPEVDAAVLAEFTAALKQTPNPVQGEAVFRKRCAECHQAHGVGFSVGPDLTAEFRRSEETFVEDILLPSAQISPGYTTYSVVTEEGELINGVLASESPTSIVLRQAHGKQQTVLRANIESLQAVDVSLMPEELARVLQPRQVANVIAWLKQPPVRRVLFDDDPAFIGALTDGGGTAGVERADRFRGALALRITPLQRHSRSIPGWNFRVRRQPAAGEFRFLRFAWKSAGARGVMIEIANRGQWPPAKKPVFRYFAGENATEWAAVRVDARTPEEWTVVTRDLWQDFGDCTITGIAPTAMGGAALFDAIELLRERPKDADPK